MHKFVCFEEILFESKKLFWVNNYICIYFNKHFYHGKLLKTFCSEKCRYEKEECAFLFIKLTFLCS